MARDRQRGKQRRARQSADRGPAARPARPDANGSGQDPLALGDDAGAAGNQGVEDVLDERGPEGSTPAPDPLKHESSYVDEAKLAEAGAAVDAPREERA